MSENMPAVYRDYSSSERLVFIYLLICSRSRGSIVATCQVWSRLAT